MDNQENRTIREKNRNNLIGTKVLSLTYGTQTKNLVRYADADGTLQEHHHAISRYTFLIDGGAISWSSHKQELVMLSTMEAKYIASMHATKEVLWLCCLIIEVFALLHNPTILYNNNQSAIVLTKDGNYHACTKHINIHYHFICFSVAASSILLLYCPVDSMVADTLAKALPSVKAKHFALELGLCNI